jgi:hypothetical protein
MLGEWRDETTQAKSCWCMELNEVCCLYTWFLGIVQAEGQSEVLDSSYGEEITLSEFRYTRILEGSKLM